MRLKLQQYSSWVFMYVWVKPFSFWAKSFMGETRGFLFGLFYLHPIWYFCNSWTFQTSYCVVQVAKFAGWERTNRVWILASSHSAKDDSFSVTHIQPFDIWTISSRSVRNLKFWKGKTCTDGLDQLSSKYFSLFVKKMRSTLYESY